MTDDTFDPENVAHYAIDERTLALLISDRESEGPSFAARDRGATYHKRFQVVAHQGSAQGRHFYFVLDQHWGLRCLNPSCRLFGAPLAGGGAGYCPECASPLEQFRPVHVLIEADNRAAFGTAPEVAERKLHHPALLAPLAYFEESDGYSVRCCLVVPTASARDASTLAGRQDVQEMLLAAIQICRGLQTLFAQGVAFRSLGPEQIVFNEMGAGLYGFENMVLYPNAHSAAMQTAANLNFAQFLQRFCRLLSGHEDFTPDSNLPPRVQALFEPLATPESLPPLAEWRKRIESVLFDIEATHKSLPPLEQPLAVMLSYASATDMGKMRRTNEDSLLVLTLDRRSHATRQALGVFAVADGIGGHAAGEVASSLAVDVIARKAQSELFSTALHFPLDAETVFPWLNEAIQAANTAIQTQRQKSGNDMGTTLVVAVVNGLTVWLAHVGDSRAYLIDDHEATALTNDHTLVAQLVSAGRLTEKDAKSHPQRSMVYKVVGTRAEVEATLRMMTLQPGQTLLLCSDGLNSLIDDAEIAEIIRQVDDLPQAAVALIRAANNAGGYDNISVVLVQPNTMPN